MIHSSIVAKPCKLMACTVLASAVAVFTISASAADVTVTQDMLLVKPFPVMTVLDHDGSGDWTSVGETQRSDRNQELAHLNDDGELVLVDDAGFQYHAVWAASRPVTPAMSWEVSFRYIPIPNPDTRYYDAGGWTFVMQNQGATAYGTSSPLLGVPTTGAYGFMFHRYYLGVRWIKNSNSINTPNHATWTHIKGANRYDSAISFSEGLDIDMTNAMDVTIGCTGRVWTVTMRQEGKGDIVLSNDFSDIIANDGTQYYIGFTGSSSWWSDSQFPVMYQKISNVAGEICVGPAQFVDAGTSYAIGANAWKTAEYAEFLSGGRLLTLDPYTENGNRKFAAVGQSPLYRKLPFSVSFEWECEYGTKGAQGISFSLVPSNMPKGGSNADDNMWGDFFYAGDANAAGFYVRPYGNEGFGWHQGGVRTSANVPYSNITSGDVMYVSADWDGDSKMVVSIRRNSGITVAKTNTFDNLPDVFYPAFHGATARGSDGPTRFVAQNYALQMLNNPAPVELGDRGVTGAQEYVLSTWSVSAYMPSAIADTLAMGTSAALTLSPDANGLGGSLHATNIEVRADSSISATSPCALLVSRISYPADATLTLSGRVLAKDGTIRVRCENGAFSRAGRHVLLNATGATGLEDASFTLDAGDGAVDAGRSRLEWDGDTLTLFVKGGFMMVVQ